MRHIRRLFASCLVIIILIAVSSTVHATEIKTETTGYIYIGDSRTVGLNNVMGMSSMEDTYVVAKVGKGYRWYISTGQYEVDAIKAENPHDNWVYIFNLGVNDLGNIEKYKALIDDLEKDATVYTVSVNPTVDTKTRVKCSSIESFNSEIKLVADNYIDTYSYLIENGFSAPDGLHYSNNTYKNIYSYIWESVI